MALILEASLKNPLPAAGPGSPGSRVWHLFTIHFKVTRGDASGGDRDVNLPVSHSRILQSSSVTRYVADQVFSKNLQVAWEWRNWQEWNTLEHWPVDLPKAKHDKAWFRVSSMAYWAIASQLFFFKRPLLPSWSHLFLTPEPRSLLKYEVQLKRINKTFYSNKSPKLLEAFPCFTRLSIS